MINFDSDQENSKMRSTDRVLVLREIPGQKVRATSGLVDPRLFKGENALHVFMDPATCLWYFKYDFVIPRVIVFMMDVESFWFFAIKCFPNFCMHSD